MKDALGNLSSPVPVEPVGIGGKWKVIQNLTTNGLAMTQTSIHELKSRTATSIDVEISVSQEADPQEIKSPLLGAGAKLMLESLETKGGGRSTIRLDSVMPAKAESQVKSKSEMTVTVGTQTQKLQTDSEIEVSLEIEK